MSEGYKLISSEGGIPEAHQVLWHFTLGGAHYVASHISCAFDTGRPECMVFRASQDGEVIDWKHLAVSYCSDPDEAFAECLHDMMLGREDDGED